MVPSGAVRDARRDSVRRSRARSPATSGSPGMSATRIRASRIASKHKFGWTWLVDPAL